MSRLPCIEGAVQEAILDILPNDGDRALAVMAQLSANMLLSVPGDLETFIARLRAEYADYARHPID